METISFPNTIFSGRRLHHHNHFPQNNISSRRAKLFVVNAERGANDKGKLVDENMIVLRMRIKDLEMEEMDGLPPTISESWMEWEKKYYPDYNKDICEAMGMLQMYLMNTRPSLVLGTFALLMLSVSLSTSIVIYNFINLVV
ncbi:hypothetical protein CTI12_AA002240 [Artemisia annua]|uniref:Uncharacterized protein n=1 Tax=Artemisia annua TaxID=35608 RepID=A0A2U1QNW0_ARTAN|nr:hypothetical protein CTI12_AA002240 [Artemisia annua]